MNRPIIMYGAGAEAHKNITRWESEGLVPVCFADKDESKQFNNFFHEGGSCDILPLYEAIRRYPDYLIYVTVHRDNMRSVVCDLLNQGIPAERIRLADNIDDSVEWRKGCDWIGRYFLLGDKIGVCCTPVYYHEVEIPKTDDLEENLNMYVDNCNSIIDDWRNDRPSVCDGCPNLRYDYFDIKPEIAVVNISTVEGEDFCNIKCCYCKGYPKISKEAFDKRGKDVIRMLEVFNRRYPGKSLEINVSGGEISVAPFRDRLFEMIKENRWSAVMYSNAVIYCNGIAKQLSHDENSGFMTTLDSTKPELFAKIKGVNALDETMANIRKYAESAASKRQFYLKIIMLDGIYEEFEDIKGVADFADELCVNLYLSCNVHNIQNELSPEAFKLTTDFIDYAKQKAIPITIMYDHFNPADAERIRKHSAAL